jgi:D-proline reductase (dithiol) PrdB
VCLIARHLESLGIATLCITSARDIIEAGNPPRAVFVDYPLGHTTGRPFDPANQLAILTEAIHAFDSINTPGQILDLPYEWSDPDWRSNAMRASDGDTRSARDESPQWQHDADRILAERTLR